tara:strand:- start:997 stop:1227 length:231 start_codon:yes stop_codon:yes gene_type:complete
MITKEEIIEVFDSYAVNSFNIEITEDDLKLFAKEIEALSQVNDVVLDDVIKCENFKCNNKAEYFYCNDCENERNDI